MMCELFVCVSAFTHTQTHTDTHTDTHTSLFSNVINNPETFRETVQMFASVCKGVDMLHSHCGDINLFTLTLWGHKSVYTTLWGHKCVYTLTLWGLVSKHTPVCTL